MRYQCYQIGNQFGLRISGLSLGRNWEAFEVGELDSKNCCLTIEPFKSVWTYSLLDIYRVTEPCTIVKYGNAYMLVTPEWDKACFLPAELNTYEANDFLFF